MSEERAKPKYPKDPKLLPPKQVSVNASVHGIQPKNTPLGRSDPHDDTVTRG
jgi:hypothetical protein